ncbi:MAG: ABC transporter permease [Ruminococcaceae bacterium]|nr:ABC transporter permease [Oscillospiraceae bacterium]
MKKFLSGGYMFLIFALLYAPIVVLIIFSFNDGGTLSEFTGFSFVWYEELFHDEEALTSLKNSLVLAVLSSLMATVIATFAALGLHHMKNKAVKGAVKSLTNIPMMNPDIVTGVSMMLLFVAVATIIKANNFMGFGTMLVAHTTFNLPYVLLSVMPRFNQLDKSLSEAAQDLGCTPTRAFFTVELPEIVPGIISGLMLGFTMSLDDFVISHFVSSPTFQTLPLYVYNQTVHNVKFSMYALCALIVAIILVILLIVNFTGSVNTMRSRKKQRRGVA